MAKARKANKDLNELKSLLKKIKESGVLPYGYAKKIKEKLGLNTADEVYQVSGGHRYNEKIADEILEMAKDNKLKQQIQAAKDILS